MRERPQAETAIEDHFIEEWRMLTYPTGRLPAGDWRGRAMEHVRRNIEEAVPRGVSTLEGGRKQLFAPHAAIPLAASWTFLGPKPLDSTGTATACAFQYGQVSGRMSAIAFEPGSTTTAYLGTPAGGLWKTTTCCDSSTTWFPLWDDPAFPTQSVGAIAIDPQHPGTIYVGTGDPAYAGAPHGLGNGVYKSTDSGATWTHHGAEVFSPNPAAGIPDQNIISIAIDPNDPDTIVAGASYGLFISRDAGETWTRYDVVDRESPTYGACAQRITSILIDGNTNPSKVYVAIGYPYASANLDNEVTGGANGVYKALLTPSGTPLFVLMANGWPAGTANGTTESHVGRIALAWDDSHTHIYAHVTDYGPSGRGQTLGIWHTANGGSAWNLLANTDEAAWTDCAGNSELDFAWYDLTIAVDPNDDKTIYTGRVNLWRLTVDDSYEAVTTEDLTGVYGTSRTGACPVVESCADRYGTCHPDQHAFAFVPGTSTFLTGNDGGIYLGTGGPGGFTQLNRGLETTQFYAGQLGMEYASGTQMIFGGMQDNGNASLDSDQNDLEWIARGGGGDGFYTAFDPINGTRTSGRWITEFPRGALQCTTHGASSPFWADCAPLYSEGEMRLFDTPFLLDQWNCGISCSNVVLGTETVWATSNGAGSWTKTRENAMPKNGGGISAINVAHSNPGSVIVGTSTGDVWWSSDVVTGANCTAALSNTASFACTPNGSANWVNLTGGNATLPNRWIGGVVFDPTTNTRFYAAVAGFNGNTPAQPGHIFAGRCSATPCTGTNVTWSDRSGNLPDIPFESIQVNPNNIFQVFAGSYLGFYFTDDITAEPVIWNRYQTGMPNTRVRYLAVDRGAPANPRSSTALAAFTFGRGVYAAKVDLPTTTGLHGEQTGYWSAGSCPNGYVRGQCTEFIPGSDFTLDTVQAYAFCANGVCPHATTFNIYAADNVSLIATSDVAYVPYCPAGDCVVVWTFSGANRVTLRAGITYHVRPEPVSGSGSVDLIVGTSQDPQRQFIFRDRTAPTTVRATLTSAITSVTQPPLMTTLHARISGGSALGPIRYSFWWDCSNTSASAAEATAACGDPHHAEVGEVHANVSEIAINTPHTYTTTGEVHPKLIVERGAATPTTRSLALTVGNAPRAIWAQQLDHSVLVSFANGRPRFELINPTALTLVQRDFRPFYLALPAASESGCLQSMALRWYPNAQRNPSEQLGTVAARVEPVPGGLLLTFLGDPQIIGPGQYFEIAPGDCGDISRSVTLAFDDQNRLSYLLGNDREAMLELIRSPEITAGGATSFCDGNSVTLTTTAADAYQWLLDGTPIAGATAHTYAATQTGNYSVRTMKSGYVAVSAAIPVSVVSITVSPSTLTAGGQGTPYGALTFTKSGGSGNASFTISGALPNGMTFSNGTLSGTPSQAGSFAMTVIATDSSGCSGSRDYILTIVEVPASLMVTFVPPSTANLSWNASSHAAGYEIMRNGVPIGTTNATTLVDSGLKGAYVYRVRALTSGSPTAYGTPDLITTIVFTDDPLIARATTFKAIHLTQLRDAVNVVRAAAGLASATFPDASPSQKPIKANHIIELRNALDPARALLGLPSLIYASSPVPGSTIHAVDLTEIRNGVK